MSQKLRLPNISGTTEQKLEQLKSYLYQTVTQLNWLLESLSAPQGQTSQDINFLFSHLRPLIMGSNEIAQTVGNKLDSRFATTENLPKAFKVQIVKAAFNGTAVIKSRFSAFTEGAKGRQVFFVCGSLGGLPVREAMVLEENGTLHHENNFDPRTTQEGEIVLYATAGDCFLVFTYLED